MPPKKVDKGQVKAEEKRKIRVAEDRTFGLKNKNKSKAVQKYIKGVQAQARPTQKSEQAAIDAAQLQKEDRKKIAQREALLASLFKGAENAKTISGKKTDPKSIREEQKIDLYVDQRQDKKEMEEWDQEKLEAVINSKHGVQNASATEIICKYFLDAVEKRSYGWFWSCPGGGDSCKYRHCLPPGYVLKAKETKDVDDDEDEEPVEDVIERERAALPAGGTPVTLESLKAWKARKEAERLAAVEEKRVAESKKTGGRGLGVLTGRDLFIFDPSLFVDDEGAASEDDYEEDEDCVGESDECDEDEREPEEGDGGNQNVEHSSNGDQPGNGPEGIVRPSQPEETSQHNQTSSSSSCGNVRELEIQRKDLFVEGEVPEDLDELDD